jgi:transcription antitermination factor NusG
MGFRMAKHNLFGGGRVVVAYCLQCQTQRCRIIAELLEKKGALRAFSPKIISRQRKRGKLEDQAYDLLPGYVFVYTEQQLENFDLFSRIDGIIRRLDPENATGGLTGADFDFAMNLYRKNGIVGTVTVFKEGDTVRIDDPLFHDYNGTIIYIDHRKQRAKLQFHFDGKDRMVWVACDILYKNEGKPNESGTK